MKLTISRSSATSAASVAVAARLFCGLAVDYPPHPGAWLSALIGTALSCPVILAYRSLRRTPHPLKLAVLLTNLAMTAGALSKIERSAGYLALDRSNAWVLLMPAAVAVAWGISRNGDAVGSATVIWRRVFLLLMVIVIALQLPYYRAAWLQPRLGLGWRAIIDGGVRAAGWVSAISGILLLADDQTTAHHDSGFAVIVIGAVAAVPLLLLRQMTTPFMPQRITNDWLLRLDSLLTNGRAPLYLQMPMILLWYVCLLHLAACTGFCAACLLQRLHPVLEGRLCALLVTLGVALAANSARLGDIMESAGQWQFAFLALLCAAALLHQARGGAAGCEKAV